MADAFKPILTLISDRLEKILPEALSGPLSLTLSAKNERLSNYGRKDNGFLMVPAQSIIFGGLRFSLKDFFVYILHELGLAIG